ncbi:MAG: M13 family metallopeptidase [Lachnospiraceae bacterium]|nr:M13 family metallopeptidase [Lachnospiraceae bacterium]
MTEFLLSEDNFKYGTLLLQVRLSTYSEDSSRYEVKIAKPDLMLGDAAEYQELTPNGERTKDYQDGAASYMLKRLGMSEEEIADTIEKAYAFDEKLSHFQKTLLEQYDPSYRKESINMVTMEEIKEMSPDFPLPEYMEKYGWSASELIDVEWPEAVTGLNSLYTEENLEELKANLLVSKVSDYITLLDEEAFREYESLSNALDGITESEPDEELAYNETKALFPDSFARLYKDRYLSEKMKNDITQICQSCIDTYSEMLDEEDWLSEETRSYAKEKLAKMKIHAVYPDKWEDYSIFHVTPASEGGTYFKAFMDYALAVKERSLGRINGSVDSEIWGVDILQPNAFYKFTDNSINIVPGLFSDATYSEDMSIEHVYGAIGCMIGHEISHGFDTNGAMYDAEGNMRDWWADEDYATFQERAAKLIDYYDQVVAFDDGTPYQGQIVQTEAIADMAGMKCILKMAEKIEDFDYDEFFKANAHLWARVNTLESCEAMVMTDSHPLHYLRGNVTVQQFDKFLETYGIEEGDGMYLAPEDRILVW